MVSITDRKLAVMESDRVVKIFPTAVGAPASPSPVGVYKIVTSIPHPTWYGKGKVVGPGKDNPLGTRWLGLSIKGYGIHGTNDPASIGHNASHGCVRMRNQRCRRAVRHGGGGRPGGALCRTDSRNWIEIFGEAASARSTVQ